MCTAKGTATATVQIENERLKVTEWRFAERGANTGWHTHAHDYVVVPLFDGTLEIDTGGPAIMFAKMQNGVPYYRPLGASHDVINGNDFECAFIEIELLQPAP